MPATPQTFTFDLMHGLVLSSILSTSQVFNTLQLNFRKTDKKISLPIIINLFRNFIFVDDLAVSSTIIS